MNYSVFVIIVTYKGHCWYDRCFSSLQSSDIPVRAVVVDNASEDGTIEYLREHYPDFVVFDAGANLGFGKANNIGIKYALEQQCDYVFLLNQDAWIEPDTLRNLIAVHERHPEYGILSPVHLNVEKDAIEKGLLNYLDDQKITDHSFFEDLYFHREKEIYETKYVNAAAWLLPRKTLETVGGFDPIFTHYGEDDNYMQRVHFHKMKIGVCPGARVVHDTVRRLPKNVKKAMTENRNLLADLTDINQDVSIPGLCLFHLRKSIGKFIRLRIPQGNKHWKNFLFILKHREQIQKSRLQNRVIGLNWL